MTDKDGNAIAGKNVILTLDAKTMLPQATGTDDVIRIQGENLGVYTSMAATDEKGIATFVLKDITKDEDGKEGIASANYTVSIFLMQMYSKCIEVVMRLHYNRRGT